MSRHRRPERVEHRFVNFVPEELEPDTLYISMDYATVVHSCLCGCGHRVVTPLTPTDWHLTYDGQTVSLSRSVGNWSFPCQSHYWIEDSRVHWARPWSKARMDANRAHDRATKHLFYEDDRNKPATASPEIDELTRVDPTIGWWRIIRSWLSGR